MFWLKAIQLKAKLGEICFFQLLGALSATQIYIHIITPLFGLLTLEFKQYFFSSLLPQVCYLFYYLLFWFRFQLLVEDLRSLCHFGSFSEGNGFFLEWNNGSNCDLTYSCLWMWAFIVELKKRGFFLLCFTIANILTHFQQMLTLSGSLWYMISIMMNRPQE